MIVVDASIITWALTDDGPSGDAARAGLADDDLWAAPAHQVAEFVSAVRGRVLGGKLAEGRATAALSAYRDMAIQSIDLRLVVDRMWELRRNLTPYDAAYVAAAERLNCTLVTGDAKLARVPGIRCRVQVVHPPH